MSANTIGGGVEFFSVTDQHKRGPVLKLHGGDHRGCKHETGVCEAKNGWSLSASGDVIRRLVQHPDHDRADAVYAVGEGRRAVSMPVWRGFGNVPWEETADVKPSPAVCKFLYDRGRREVDLTAKHHRYSLAETRLLLSEYDEKFGHLLPPKLEKPKRGGK